MEPVRSHRNRHVVEAARLHRSKERQSSGRTILEGPHLLAEALSAGVTPEIVFALADDQWSADMADRHGFELVRVEPAALHRVAGTRTPRGPAAVITVPPPTRLEDRCSLVAWGVSDPGNVGTLIRTAAAFAWDFGHTPGTADPWSPKVLRSGAGGHFRIGIGAVSSLEELTAGGLTLAATVVRGGVAPEDLGPGRYAVLVGEEASGLPAGVVDAVETKVTVPMPGGTESLNVAIAAALVVYELSKYQAPTTKYGRR